MIKNAVAAIALIACTTCYAQYASGILSIRGTIVPSCDPITGKGANGGELFCERARDDFAPIAPVSEPAASGSQVRIQIDSAGASRTGDEEGVTEVRLEDATPAAQRQK